MSQEVVVTILVAIAAVASVVGLATGKAGRVVAGASLVLVGSALLVAWSSSAYHELDKTVTVLAGILAVAGGGLVTSQVFSFVEDPERVRDAGAVLRGGAWIGALERLAVYVALVAGWAPGLAIVLAVKGLGRYPELRNQEDTGVAERFIIGTFASVLWAVACAGVAVLAP
jgi:cytochrome c biogenesis protein CcdA